MMVDPLSEATDVSAYIPWFLACHPSRYPYWHGMPDPRNK